MRKLNCDYFSSTDNEGTWQNFSCVDEKFVTPFSDLPRFSINIKRTIADVYPGQAFGAACLLESNQSGETQQGLIEKMNRLLRVKEIESAGNTVVNPDDNKKYFKYQVLLPDSRPDNPYMSVSCVVFSKTRPLEFLGFKEGDGALVRMSMVRDPNRCRCDRLNNNDVLCQLAGRNNITLKHHEEVPPEALARGNRILVDLLHKEVAPNTESEMIKDLTHGYADYLTRLMANIGTFDRNLDHRILHYDLEYGIGHEDLLSETNWYKLSGKLIEKGLLPIEAKDFLYLVRNPIFSHFYTEGERVPENFVFEGDNLLLEQGWKITVPLFRVESDLREYFLDPSYKGDHKFFKTILPHLYVTRFDLLARPSQEAEILKQIEEAMNTASIPVSRQIQYFADRKQYLEEIIGPRTNVIAKKLFDESELFSNLILWTDNRYQNGVVHQLLELCHNE